MAKQADEEADGNTDI